MNYVISKRRPMSYLNKNIFISSKEYLSMIPFVDTLILNLRGSRVWGSINRSLILPFIHLSRKWLIT